MSPQPIVVRFTLLLTCVWILFGFELKAEACSLSRLPSVNLICPVDRIHIVTTHIADVQKSLVAIGPFPDDHCFSGIQRYPIHVCPVCHFAGTQADFAQNVSEPIKQQVLLNLKTLPFKADNLIAGDLTLEIYTWQNRTVYEKGKVALATANQFSSARIEHSPIYYEKDSLIRASYFYALAIYYLELAWNKQLVPKVDQPLIAFQIAEMYRRLGTFDRALAWFKQADNIGGIEELNPYLKKQMKRAQEKDNRQFISSAHDSF